MSVHIYRKIGDYADTRFSNFVMKYLHENEKVSESVFACSYGPKLNLLNRKSVKNLVTLSL